MKKISKLFLIIVSLSISIVLSSCSSKPKKDNEMTTKEVKEIDEIQEKDESSFREEKDDSEEELEGDYFEFFEGKLGESRKMYEAVNLNLQAKSGPAKITLNHVFIIQLDIDIDPNLGYVTEIDGKTEGKQTLLLLDVTVENKSEEDIQIYPDQSYIVTNTKEQKESDGYISDMLGGEYFGEVKKEGIITFPLDSSPDEIKSIKYIVNPPRKLDSHEDLGDNIVIEYELE